MHCTIVWLCRAIADERVTRKPQLLIVPKYLDFFLAAEERAQALDEPRRIPPDLITYAEHCHVREPERVPEADKDKGGLYSCYMESAFLGPWSRLEPGVDHHVQWAGDPMAMLHRAMCVSSQIVWSRGLPQHVQDKLRELQALYSDGDRRFMASAGTAQDKHTPGPPPPVAPSHASPPPPSHTPSPAPSQAGPSSSAAPLPSHVHGHGHVNVHAATGMPSPLSSFTPSPDKPLQRKMKRNSTEISLF